MIQEIQYFLGYPVVQLGLAVLDDLGYLDCLVDLMDLDYLEFLVGLVDLVYLGYPVDLAVLMVLDFPEVLVDQVVLVLQYLLYHPFWQM